MVEKEAATTMGKKRPGHDEPGPEISADGRLRPVIEAVRPTVDGGRFPAKAAVGDVVLVEADIMADGHDLLICDVASKAPRAKEWSTVAMEPVGNDRWRAGFAVSELGEYRFIVTGEVDRFGSWCRTVRAKVDAGQGVSVDLPEGSDLLRGAAGRARGDERRTMELWADHLDQLGLRPSTDLTGPAVATLVALLDDRAVAELARRYGPGPSACSDRYTVRVEPALARFGTWYELFPRSASPDPARPGTLADVAERLDYVEHLGADVLYLPPIHPIGTTSRKGRDGAPEAGPADPGSPWAIGSPEGGHTSVDPGLGTIADFDHLVEEADRRRIKVALDLAFQCSPDHPWVTEHPEWFRHRADGSIRFAENPPKRYEDIYPFDFESDAWRELWRALLEVVRFWIGHGITVFRVDNPHTKPFVFWEWLIASVRQDHPGVLFLSEAFTRPKVMQRLAKIGFSQSYTYFTWRNSKWELESYLDELTQTPIADYLRPNLWPNTPDILTSNLQQGTTATFVARLVLAATLAASYGIYGPAFELQQRLARSPDSEEYAHSEKYTVRHWDLESQGSLAELVARVNIIRRENPALQRNDTLRFHRVDNDQLLAYSKSHLVEHRRWAVDGAGGVADDANAVLVVVNLDPSATQAGWVTLDLDALGLAADRPFVVHDLLTDARFEWQGSANFVELDPDAVPAHILALPPPGRRRA
jgi:starch synthase (maltosyl-transferring)